MQNAFAETRSLRSPTHLENGLAVKTTASHFAVMPAHTPTDYARCVRVGELESDFRRLYGVRLACWQVVAVNLTTLGFQLS